MLVVSNEDDDDGMVEVSAFKAREAGEYSDVLGRKREGESAWQVGDEAWLCHSETQARTLTRLEVLTQCLELQRWH